MTLRAAPTLAGRQITVQSPTLGRAVVINVGEDGLLSQEVLTQVVRDGDGNLLETIEVAHPHPGEPALQFFAFPELDEVPQQYLAFSQVVNDRRVVPARYVRGVHTEKVAVELSEELEEDILAHQATAGLIRREEVAEDAEEAGLQEEPDSEAEGQPEDSEAEEEA